MSDNEFMDFDTMLEEDVKEEGFKYKLFGIEGEIPPKIPFGIILQYERNKHRADEEKGLELTLLMLESIFGEDVVTRWSRNPKFDDTAMTKVLQWGLSKYGLGEQKKTARGKLKVVKSE